MFHNTEISHTAHTARKSQQAINYNLPETLTAQVLSEHLLRWYSACSRSLEGCF